MSELVCAGERLDCTHPQVMGILNLTPDSFSDGGELLRVNGDPCRDAVLRRSEAMIAAGAAILDLGGESTRPGAAAVSSTQEMERVIPVVEWLRQLEVLISVDTSKPAVMREACARGANLINDVRALSVDGAVEVMAGESAAVCLMHMQGDPATMQLEPHYADVVGEVAGFLRKRLLAMERAGISRERCVVDPGIGFGKTVEHNLTLLASLPALAELGVPVMIGVSRKSMLGKLTGRDVKTRVNASVAAALYGVMRGARIVRTHDVAATVDALKVWEAVARHDRTFAKGEPEP
jgi:dihydropteroate synthase